MRKRGQKRLTCHVHDPPRQRYYKRGTKGDDMKINLLGTFGVIGVVASFTAACGGSPIKPTASNPVSGDGGSAPSVTVSNPRTVVGLEVCANQPPEDPYAEGPAAPVAMCDVYAPDEPAGDVATDDVAADQAATDEVVVSEPSTTDEILSARSFHR